MYTLSHSKHLIIHNTMQRLCLDNNEREETVNGYLANTANRDVVQPSVSFESPEEMLYGSSPIVDKLPFPRFGWQSLLGSRILFNNRLSRVLAFMALAFPETPRNCVW